MRKFKLRFEAQVDLALLIVCASERTDVRLIIIRLDKDEAVLKTDQTLVGLRNLIRKVPDGHVMLQTVAPVKNYTGERDYT